MSKPNQPSSVIDSDLWGEMSPTVKLAELEYQAAGIEPWTNAQVVRLCRMLNCTVRELAALIAVFDSKALRKCWNKNVWPLPWSLQFYKLRRFRMGVHEPDAHDGMLARVLEKSLPEKSYSLGELIEMGIPNKEEANG